MLALRSLPPKLKRVLLNNKDKKLQTANNSTIDNIQEVSDDDQSSDYNSEHKQVI